MSPCRVAACLEAVGEDRGPGVDRRVHVTEIPLVRGQLAVGMQVLSRSIRLELRLAEVLVHQREASTWNARSHAAYHGYSHLSGIEMMSALYMWCQCSLREAGALGPNGSDAALLQPPVDVEVVELLRPEHPRQRLAHHVCAVVAE